MHAPPVGQTQTASPKQDLRKEADKRAVQLEYDVSKTIVDGSNPMKLVQPQPFLSGECLNPSSCYILLIHHFFVISQIIIPIHTPHRPPRALHEDRHENPSSQAMPFGWATSHLEPTL